MTHCPSCDRDVPEGTFCGVCGAHLAHQETSPGRVHTFAANPTEHVLQLALVSTLLPHLPHRRSAPFRVAIAVVALLVLAAGVLRLQVPAIALAAAAMPILYLVYLYEVEVYEDEPWLVVGITFVLGIALGALWGWKVAPFATAQSLAASTFGPSPSLALSAAGLAVGAQLAMLAGAALLFFLRPRFDEALDGFTFGAAAALGFTLASTLVELAPELAGGAISTLSSATNALEIAQRGLLLPWINACTTALVAAALWLQRGRRSARAGHPLATLPVALLVAFAIQALLGVVNVLVLDTALQVAAYALASVVMLVVVRGSIHWMLLAEAVEVEVGPDALCSNCHHVVPTMAFCPVCGIARRATPKTGDFRQARAVR